MQGSTLSHPHRAPCKITPSTRHEPATPHKTKLHRNHFDKRNGRGRENNTLNLTVGKVHCVQCPFALRMKMRRPGAYYYRMRIAKKSFVSDFVIDEISRGDPDAASLRIEAVRGFKKLALSQTVLDLARKYKAVLSIPKKARLDLFHLAICVGNGIDYVLSWNFKHIANAVIREKLQDVNMDLGLRTPIICTPEELIGGTYE